MAKPDHHTSVLQWIWLRLKPTSTHSNGTARGRCAHLVVWKRESSRTKFILHTTNIMQNKLNKTFTLQHWVRVYSSKLIFLIIFFIMFKLLFLYRILLIINRLLDPFRMLFLKCKLVFWRSSFYKFEYPFQCSFELFCSLPRLTFPFAPRLTSSFAHNFMCNILYKFNIFDNKIYMH